MSSELTPRVGDEETMTIGFIGLGAIGGPMARHLIGRPGGLVVCDTSPAAIKPFETAGATVASTPRQVAEHCQVISLMVRDDEQVREVITGADGLAQSAQPGTIVAIHSTIRAETAIELAAELAPRDILVVDAPVSGSAIGAHDGNLAVMFGGDSDALETCRAAFAPWAGLVVQMGPVGSGTRAKLARNLLTFVSYTAAAEAQRLAEAAGISLGRLAQIVRHSDGITGGPSAVMIRRTTEQMAPDDPLLAAMQQGTSLGIKDLTFALELGASLGVDLPLASYALDHLAEALGVPDQLPE